MKKGLLKRFLAIMLAFATVIGMNVSSVAAAQGEDHAATYKVVSTGSETATVKVTGVAQGDVLKAYKVVDITYDKTTNSVKYAWNSQIKTEAEKIYATVEDYMKAGDAGAKKLYTALIANYSSLTAADTKTAGSTGTVEFNLPMGQYLIVGEGYNVYAPMTATIEPTVNPDNSNEYVIYDVNIEAKATTPSVDKKVQDKDKNWVDSTSTKINEEREYKITVQAPIYPEDAKDKLFRVNDSMETGLKGAKDLKIVNENGDTLTSPADYSITYTDSEGNTVDAAEATKFTIEFNMDSDKVAGQKLTITYTSVATADLKPGTPAKNNVTLEWPKNLWNTDSGYNKEPDETKVYTYGIKVQKTKEDGTSKLAGAEFKLYADKDCTQELHFIELSSGNYVLGGTSTDNLVCDADGHLTLTGLDEGTYYLKEVKAPTDYTLLSEPIEVKVTKVDNGTYYTYSVKNTKGLKLPKTGDTAMLTMYIAGAAVALLGIAMLMNAKRKQR